MKCIINSVLEIAARKKKPLSVISRYIRLKYNIMLDEAVLRKRLSMIKTPTGI